MYNDSHNAMLTASTNFPGTCLALSRKRQQRCTNSSLRFRLQSLNKFYTFVLIFSIILPITMSIPLRDKRSSSNKTTSAEKPHWVNPCPGVPNSTSVIAEKRSVSDEENAGPESDYLNSIGLSAKHALFQAEKFREGYVFETFSVDFNKHHLNWKSAKYGWLTQEVILPKELGEKIPLEELSKMDLEEVAGQIYQYLQRLAVAFEQVNADQRETNSKFKEEFAIAEIHLKSILCELREIIPESKLALYQNATREIMPLEFRHMDDHTYRHVRDWLIFRDYMNLVEYLIQVVDYYKTKTV